MKRKGFRYRPGFPFGHADPTCTADRKGVRVGAGLEINSLAGQGIRGGAPDPGGSSSPVPFFSQARGFQRLWPLVEQNLECVFGSGKFSHGAQVAEWEKALSALTGARYAIAVNSGTDALVLLLRACGLRPGDEVLVPAYSFFATASSVVLAGGVPRFVDIDPATYAMDPGALAEAVTPACRFVMPVHLFHTMADMAAIGEVARTHGLTVVEDSAEAIGMRRGGRHAGLFGAGGVLSFFPSKTLGALGDAGAVLTDDPELACTVDALRHHGRAGHTLDNFPAIATQSSRPGVNSKMDDVQAAVLLAKSTTLEEDIARRAALAARYTERLRDIPGVLRLPRSTARPERDDRDVFYVYLIEAERRDDLVAHLDAHGIGTEVYYPVPLPRQPAFAGLGCRDRRFPHAEAAAGRAVALPLYPDLGTEEIDRVCEAVADFYVRQAARAPRAPAVPHTRRGTAEEVRGEAGDVSAAECTEAAGRMEAAGRTEAAGRAETVDTLPAAPDADDAAADGRDADDRAGIGAVGASHVPPVRVEFFPRKLFEADRKELIGLFREVALDPSQRFILGSRTEEFERVLRDSLGAPDVVLCGSGTSALELVLTAMEVGAGDEVVVPAFGCAPLAAAVVNVGGTPVFADIDPHTMVVDPDDVERRIGPRTVALMPAHMFSVMADMPRFTALARRHGLRLVEDSAVAQGAVLGSTPAGLWGDAGVFSFVQVKSCGMPGEGGAVVTRDSRLAARVRMLRNHGQDGRQRFVHHLVGRNSRFDEVQAAFQLHRFDGFPERLERRARIADYYTERFAPLAGQGIVPPPAGRDGRCYYVYTLLVEERDALRAHLDRAGVATHVYYPLPLPEQAAFAPYAPVGEQWPRARAAAARALSLPVHHLLSDAEVEHVADSVCAFTAGR
ncbi:DegT/DnrJ/EryC1/StrS family aminotransferase [Streptomyces sp. NPDC001750]|uniref:DegT/DnrJ/EryC1/StrS family aminotransferase n=1 Tax=unclassified Streptomyces TaxID=2593676 RepID=UPI0036C4AEA7